MVKEDPDREGEKKIVRREGFNLLASESAGQDERALKDPVTWCRHESQMATSRNLAISALETKVFEPNPFPIKNRPRIPKRGVQ